MGFRTKRLLRPIHALRKLAGLRCRSAAAGDTIAISNGMPAEASAHGAIQVTAAQSGQPNPAGGQAELSACHLLSALSEGKLNLHYQPKLRLRSGAVDGCEALIRWAHPALGVLNPDCIIPLAERSGLMREVTEWVLARVLADWGVLREAGVATRLYVNVAGNILGDRGFIDHVLATTADNPAAIGLEVTETEIIPDPDSALAHLQELADAGLRISIDDYGAGLSSLSYLKRLPAHELKIDRAFISDITRSHRDPLLVRSTIDLAHALGLEVTAEGVESSTAQALLSVMGCDLVQGFGIAKPMSLPQLVEHLRDARDESEPAGLFKLSNR